MGRQTVVRGDTALTRVARDEKKEFERLIRSVAGRHETWRVFADFCEMAALSFRNVLPRDEAIEARYLRIAERYDAEEIAAFPKMLGCVVSGLESLECDFLGEMFMAMELGNHWKGQFFTPFNLALMMATLNAPPADDPRFVNPGYVTVQELCVGAGGMVIAFARALKDAGVNFQEAMHVHATDVDATAVHMAYVQMTLLHIPAVIVLGNSLSMETREVWRTLNHDLGLWDARLRLRTVVDAVRTAEEMVVAVEREDSAAEALEGCNVEVQATLW